MSSDLSGAEPLLAQPLPPASAGAMLRDLRSKQGLHIGAMAAMLKVPQAKLEALEADRWKDLPDATFARALAKAMCRVLKVDAQAVLALLPKGNEPELMVSRGLNQPYREHDGRSEGLSLAIFKRPLVLSALLLLAAAAAVYLMPAGWVDKLGQSQVKAPELLPAPQSNPVVEEPTLIEPAASAVLPAIEPSPAASLAAATTLMPVAVAPVKAASNTAAVASSAVAPAAVPQAAPAGAVPLTIKISAESWVEVVDARGQVLLSKTLRVGEDQTLSGLPPLKVKVGNVAGTEMHLRGSKVDLAGQAQNNVARIELN
ncbi:helix-turn-helix domain-containing protein [Paucibacter sp. B2R-40]|uniref:helix-turn-helix domain-containing protein n=1 Tax=Paucibacter sp. B2R-40 TaxID=2893554 RepID=UPI0021E4FD93|nr:helix-turn-helix domain-containing protein [Paucibacter sp. B2R-40]MCV2355156.1 helix-turn-helix domain-containing protein [Paucibacter sp. B2R-40]